MRFHGIVVVYKSDELSLAVEAILEGRLLMPHLHQSPDHSFGLPVSLWGFHLRISLLDLVFRAELHEGVILMIASVFQSVVRVGLFDGVGAFIQHLPKKLFTGILGLVRENRGKQFSGKVIDPNKEILMGSLWKIPR